MSTKQAQEERSFLSGPRSRWEEFRYTIGVMRQFIRGFRTLHFAGPCITIFGSARFPEDHSYYRMARSIAHSVADMGFTIMTGGGPGIMEAANRGARESGGKSIGCNIVLPREQHPNNYLDRFVNIDFFFVRKELLRKYSHAFIVFPGGFGTLDEFFETITLIQTKKTAPFPVIIIGKQFHEHLMAHIELMVQEGTISEADLKLMLFTDDLTEALEHISEYVTANPTVHLKPKKKALWLLGEKELKP
jgi:uncharacterized protein (TIGR00730 family)